MAFNDGYYKYVSASEIKRKAQKKIESLKKKNPGISPVILTGNKIAGTWWGKAWNDNLESYSDYYNRIGRGRSYVRNGAVLDLKIEQGIIKALVQGSRAKPYEVMIVIKPLQSVVWESIVRDCAGKIGTLQELIEGKFPKALAELFTAKGKGLFPEPKEISMGCSCPDWAGMCKHIAAALYGVGARLDNDATLFFKLRSINVGDLISAAIEKKTETMLGKSGSKSSRIIKDSNVNDIFGIELENSGKKKVKTGRVKSQPDKGGS
ncbi:MAG: hypothetical protein PHG48_02165 [Eubacteriales bacterium]|nr:hypothetical protein [Eubacteriales bacterium]